MLLHVWGWTITLITPTTHPATNNPQWKHVDLEILSWRLCWWPCWREKAPTCWPCWDSQWSHLQRTVCPVKPRAATECQSKILWVEYGWILLPPLLRLQVIYPTFLSLTPQTLPLYGNVAVYTPISSSVLLELLFDGIALGPANTNRLKHVR